MRETTRHSILEDIRTIGSPLLARTKPGTVEHARQERGYNILAERLAAARSGRPAAFASALAEVRPKVAAMISDITDPMDS